MLSYFYNACLLNAAQLIFWGKFPLELKKKTFLLGFNGFVVGFWMSIAICCQINIEREND